MLTAAELHRRGRDASNAGRFARARTILRTALERSDGDDERAGILLSLAHVESELGSLSAGLDSCAQALSVPGIDSRLRGLISSQRAMLLGRSGQTDAALAAFDEALRLLDGDQELMTARLNRGNVYLQRGEPRRAIVDFRRAIQYAERAGLAVPRAKAEFNLGYAHLLAGELVFALQQMDKARPVLAALSLVSQAVFEQDRAEVLAASGMIEDAEHALRHAAHAFAARGLTQQQGEAEFALARLLMLDNPSEAARVAARAARRFRNRGSETWARRADAAGLVGTVRVAAPTRSTLARIDEVVSDLVALGLRTDAQTLQLQTALALARAGQLTTATSRLADAKATTKSPIPARLLAREVRARIAIGRHRRDRAVTHLRRGLADLHDWQSTFGSLEFQSSIVGHGRGLALAGLSAAVADGRPTVVFEWAERARALASRVPSVRPPVDEKVAADLAEFRQIQAEIAEAEARGVVTKALITRANRLRDDIRQQSWYGKGSGVVTEPASLDATRQALTAAGGTLLSYLVVDGEVGCLVVSEHEPELVALGPFDAVAAFTRGMQADLDMAAARHSELVGRHIRAGLAERLRRLSAMLVAPLGARVGEGPVAIVPSGSLSGVPWSLLDGLSGRPLTVPRSATSWLNDRDGTRRQSNAGFVAGPRVERAGEEVERASRAWPDAEVLTGEQAESGHVLALASHVDVFHVAAHGRHSADNPLFSGLELADGPWYGYDIDQVPAIPSTVILSACEVGRSSVRWGEETLGMTVAWLHAGAHAVIASPALVNDDVACEVLARTHIRLAAGTTASLALAEATTEAGADMPVPFTCFGSGW